MSLNALFRTALLDPEAPLPPGLTSWNGSDPAQRFAVYRNNVTVSLIEALGAGFPVVRAMVGEAFFRDMARVFLRTCPPRSPMLMGYGAAFPAFLARFEPVEALPYLPDLARLELARRQSFHATDAEPLAPEAFAALDPEALADLSLKLHPSLIALASPHAIVSLWAAHQGHGALETVEPCAPEEALILRPHDEVVVLRLPPGGALFFARLAAGQTLGAATLAASATPGFSVSECLHTIVAQGAATAFAITGDGR